MPALVQVPMSKTIKEITILIEPLDRSPLINKH